MRISNGAAIACLVLLAGSCESSPKEFSLGGFRYSVGAFEQWKLPKSLREISGLAVSPDGRVYAHADERAVIHQLDYRGGRLVKSFALAKPNGKVVKGDFEGLAAVNEDLYVVTSGGRLYRFRPGIDGGKVGFETLESGAGDICEVEGLTYDEAHHGLLMACKHVYGTQPQRPMVLFYSLRERALDLSRTIRIAGSGTLNLSGLTISPRSGNLLMVAARQRAALEATAAGEIVQVFRWPMERYHRQSEGIVQLADGTLLVADEGKGKRGRLGVYRAII